jgi:hypothetical protein
MAYAISLKTESGDDYLYCVDVLDDAVFKIKQGMGEELAYVYSAGIASSISPDEKCINQLRELIGEAIEKAQESI